MWVITRQGNVSELSGNTKREYFVNRSQLFIMNVDGSRWCRWSFLVDIHIYILLDTLSTFLNGLDFYHCQLMSASDCSYICSQIYQLLMFISHPYTPFKFELSSRSKNSIKNAHK
ncbi:hypothetical protein C8R41DRAFT_365352 [Lentinula lateritia]|uniref:Uncharacterized protein n=1 Tax=Lentinula lateritia TaxID=40482 RepID=A0ABQ8VJW6_9AGAR|nr:hypothetical protein C8R41DRAFT_365352 [Lentinula lateritia]